MQQGLGDFIQSQEDIYMIKLGTSMSNHNSFSRHISENKTSCQASPTPLV